MGKDSPSPPPAPDYAGAAQATAAGNADAARIGAKANRVSQYTPYGNLVYTNGINGDQDQWRADVTLSPAQQQLLDQQNRMSTRLAGLGEKGVGYVANTLDTPFDWSTINQKTPAAQAGKAGWDRAYNSIIDRSQPVWDRKQSQLQTQLANQGIAPGTEAWKNAMDDYSRSYNDFQLGAQQQATGQEQAQFGLDQQARQQAVQEQSFARNEPLNMLNAVRSGSQVTNPTFTNVPQQQTVAGPNLLGAVSNQYQNELAGYNAQQQANSNMMGGLFSLGGTVLGASKAPWWMAAA